MAKTYMRRIHEILEIPTSQNFSDFKYPEGEEFNPGDGSSSEDAMISSAQADAYLLSLLKGMDDRDKIILMYQILRESGYNLNHADCAMTLNITRERYMVILKNVKKRAAKILQIPVK